MVDFRYHIVSLISVFLALAIGIVLGAGPLRENLGDSLTNQVGVLREEKEQLRAELQQSQLEQQISDSLMLAGGREVLATSLNTYTVAMVDLGETENSDHELVLQGLEAANATTVSPIQVTPEWWAPGRASFRSGIATSLLEYLDPQPPEASSTDFILGMALAQALTARDAAEPTRPATTSEQILSILTSANLIEEPAGPLVPAHAISVFVPHLQDDDDEKPDLEPWVQTLAGIGQSPAVAIAELEANDTVLGALRDESGTSITISSTDSSGMAVSEILVPRILAHEILGNRNHFSVTDSDYVLWPGPAMLEPWDPTPEPVEEEEGAESNDEAATDEAATGEDTTGDETEAEVQSLGENSAHGPLAAALVGR